MSLGGFLASSLYAAAIVLASACALVGAPAAVRAAPQTAARAGADTGTALWLPGGPAVGVSGGMSTVLSGGGTLQDTVVSLAIGHSSYQIPVDALPYLGHGLDPGLFNTADLLAAEKSGKLAIQLSYAGQLPSIPGVTITSSGGGTAMVTSPNPPIRHSPPRWPAST